MFKRDLPLETVKHNYSDEESEFILIDGVDIHYKDEGDGTPLVLVHSLDTTLMDWDGWIEHLQEDFRIIRLDLPGFGLSDCPDEFDFQKDSYIYFLKKFIAALRLENVIVGGVAWGADLAWHYATLSPYLIDKLVLINPSDHPNYHPPFYQNMSKHPLGSWIYRWSASKRIIKKRAKKWFQNQEALNEEMLERFQDMLLREDNRKAFIKINKSSQKNRYERLSSLEIPTFLMCSDALGKNPMEKHLPNVTTIYYKNARIYPMIELPEQSAKDVLAFLKK